MYFQKSCPQSDGTLDTSEPRNSEALGCDEAAGALALMSCPHMGTARIKRALDVFGGVVAAFEALREGEAFALATRRDHISRAVVREISNYLGGYDVGAAADRLEKLGGRVISSKSPTYPAALATSPFAPPFLAVAGKQIFLECVAVAVVGTRKATATGLEVARRFGHDLAEVGVGVVSGMAKGIDAAVHRGSLGCSGSPRAGASIAVLGSGIDVAYPRQNTALYEKLLEDGVVISQYGIGAPPERWRFPERNRTIAGLSAAVVVVESYSAGGALSTAAAALELGRDVFAVPGSVLNPAADGCNGLIFDGALVARSAKDVLDCLEKSASPVMPFVRTLQAKTATPPVGSPENAGRSLQLTGSQQEILRLMFDGEPRTISQLCSLVGRGPEKIIDDLSFLSDKKLVAPFGQERFVISIHVRSPRLEPY